MDRDPNKAVAGVAALSEVATAVRAILGGLGIHEGDRLFVHSGFRSLSGSQPRGASNFDFAGRIWQGFLEAVGPRGTVLVPALSHEYFGQQNPVFDEALTRCCVGFLAEQFRVEIATARSLDPAYSVCGYGAALDWFLGGHLGSLTPFGTGSPFARFLGIGRDAAPGGSGGKGAGDKSAGRGAAGKSASRVGALASGVPLDTASGAEVAGAGGSGASAGSNYIVFLGCSPVSNTCVHAVEDWLGVPWLYGEACEAALIDVAGQVHRKTTFLPGFVDRRQRYDRLVERLPEDGVRRGSLLGAEILVLDAGAVRDTAATILRENPDFLVEPLY